MQSFDMSVFRFINGWPDWMNPLFYSLSEGNKWWPVRVLLLLFLIYCLWKKELRRPVLVALIGVGLSNEACDALKYGFQMMRPSAELEVLNLRVNRLTSFGTASAHAANMASVAAAYLWFSREKWYGWFWLGIAFLTGLSRIYVGVHYPYQVLYGWIVGATVVSGVWLVWGWIEGKFFAKGGEDVSGEE